MAQARNCWKCGESLEDSEAAKCPVCHSILHFRPATRTEPTLGPLTAHSMVRPDNETVDESGQTDDRLMSLTSVDAELSAKREHWIGQRRAGTTLAKSVVREIEQSLSLLRLLAGRAAASRNRQPESSGVEAEMERFLALRIAGWEALRQAIKNRDDSALNLHEELWEQTRRLEPSVSRLKLQFSQDANPITLAKYQHKLQQQTPHLFVTPLLVLANVAIFAFAAVQSSQYVQFEMSKMIGWGANYGPMTLGDQSWRLFTSMFLHFGIMHIGFNMYMLWSVGRTLERTIGNLSFLAVYFLAGISGSLASLIWNPTVISAGASGAVFGVAGGLISIYFLRRDRIPTPVARPVLRNLLMFLGYNVIFGFMFEFIDNAAHIGGLLAGLVVGSLLSQSLECESLSQRWRGSLLAAMTGVALLSAAALFLPPRPIDLMRVLGEVTEAESIAVPTNNRLNRAYQDGEINGFAYAEQLEDDVLKPWSELTEQVTTLDPADYPRPEKLRLLQQALRTREQSWQLRVESLRTGDYETYQRSIELWKSADRLYQQSSE